MVIHLYDEVGLAMVILSLTYSSCHPLTLPPTHSLPNSLRIFPHATRCTPLWTYSLGALDMQSF